MKCHNNGSFSYQDCFAILMKLMITKKELPVVNENNSFKTAYYFEQPPQPICNTVIPMRNKQI